MGCGQRLVRKSVPGIAAQVRRGFVDKGNSAGYGKVAGERQGASVQGADAPGPETGKRGPEAEAGEKVSSKDAVPFMKVEGV
jgi:hypothetical protein